MSTQTSDNNKRIAKNTLLLYFRMLFMMVVSLYTSRVILNALGVEDFGIYNVVGGVVAMFTVISGSLSAAISRFITYELGKGDQSKLNKIFSASVTIQLLLSLIIVVLIESVGVWFLNAKMTIPADRMAAANWVLQFSIITFVINLISVPYNAAIIAHGKMTEEELNPVWQHLLNGEIDILVCTTLIETGIDVRNCNTLIIEDADRMGLAQLYQIRGRVGRSGRKAYAYFTFRRDKTLTDIAQKRLSAIREFTAFGSGFRIAMRDLQIRGAGSLLGHSQHGHMEAVGYDLYVKMLGQAIARAKGEPIQRDKSECLVDLRVDAFIPEKYIADGPGRIEAYKRIAAIQTPEDAADVLDELIDRYGDPPPSVSDLVNVSLVRVQATAVGVYEVTQKKDTLLLQVETLDVAMIRGLLIAFNGRVTAGAGTKPYLSVTLQPDEKPLELLQSILKAMADILAAPPEENTGKK